MSRPFHATKFRTEFVRRKIPHNSRIEELKGWCIEFHRLNLAPLHRYGACGNLSFRLKEGEVPFIITASGASFQELPADECFVEVNDCDLDNGIVYAEGAKEPSSESMFHYAIYRKRMDVNAVFHGHSRQILSRAPFLGLTETLREEPYGTLALANSIMDVLDDQNFLIIRNHGFVALGSTMTIAGELALEVYRKTSSSA